VVGNRRPTHGAEVDCIETLETREAVAVHHPPGLEVMAAPPGEIDPVERHVAAGQFGNAIQDSDALGDDSPPMPSPGMTAISITRGARFMRADRACPAERLGQHQRCRSWSRRWTTRVAISFLSQPYEVSTHAIAGVRRQQPSDFLVTQAACVHLRNHKHARDTTGP